MHSKKFLFIFLFILLQLKAFSAVFVVTSNADSGPGTLRDALTQAAANGTVTKDYINFNLPDTSATGRTINLITELPNLTSNLVIDASTQIGGPYGLSGAHVELNTPRSFDTFTLFVGNELNDVEFYGLYMHDFTSADVLDPDQQPRNGVNITNSSNIIFGSPGKGNRFFGFNTITVALSSVNYVTFQSNVIGLSSTNSVFGDGTQYIGTPGVSLYKCNNILIGGDATDDGNTVFSAFNIQLDQKTINNNITIKWNTFGVYQDGKSIDFAFQEATYLYLSTIGINDNLPDDGTLANGAAVNADIENNLAGVFSNAFIINAINGQIDMYNNFLGVSRDGTVNLNQDSHADDGTPIRLNNCRALINIGSNDPTKGNFLAYSTSTVFATNCPYILDRNNEYECIGFSDIYGDPISIYGNDNLKGTLPTISIDGVNNSNGQSVLTGSATPGSVVDIYGSESCTYSSCSIRKLIETVTADANGVWKSDLINFSGTFYVSATKNNITSTFKTFDINIDKVISTSIRCNGPGTITGIQLPKGVIGHWLDNNGNIVSNELVLVTNTPGDYQFVLGDGCIRSPFFHILDERVMIYDFSLVTTNPSCGNQNGAISGLFAYDPENKINKTEWFDANGNIVRATADINDLAAGSYTYKVFTSDGCEVDYGPVNLKNTTGPNIDQTQQKIQSTNCGQSTGAITNLAVTGSGTLIYTWLNNQQQTVGTNKDLTGVPAGVYQLKVTDASQCGPVYSTDITIPETNSITMDESAEVTANAACGNPTGSITGIQVTGATAYVWTDANNKTYTTSTPDLINIPPGTYILTAANSTCSKTSKTYTVTQPPPTQYPAYVVTQVPPCSGQSDGSLTVATDFLVKSARWANSQNQSAGSGSTATNLSAGTYQLFFTDNNGCETLYGNYNLTDLQPLAVMAQGVATASTCGLNNGSITGPDISGGATPYNFSWTDASGNAVGTNSSQLSNLLSGTYNLTVTDSRCGVLKASYTITDNPVNIPTPSVSNIQLCSSGSALIKVNNAVSTAKYNLYSSLASNQPIDQQTGGIFKVTATNNTTFYITQINGTCESSRAEVDVTVGISAINIANTFTPNGDNINDYWVIKNIENYPTALVQVFNRYGQKLFESKGYGKPFDGTYNGKNLPSGVYYYIINLSTNCNLLSGSLTIIR